MHKPEPDIRLRPRSPVSEDEALQRLSKKRGKPIRPVTRRVSTGLKSVTRDILKDGGTGIGPLKAKWRSVVGDRLAAASTPVKLSGKPGERVLTLQILPAAAPLFQHHGEALRKKVSLLMGGELKSIRLVQDAQGKSQKSGARTAPLSLQDRKALEAALTDIKNQQLSDALLAFGQAVYKKEG